jgi:microcystin-dependent protein
VTKKIRDIIAAVGLVLFVAALVWVFVPPPSSSLAQFPAQGTWGGTSGGTANAQTLTIANYRASTAGIPISFLAGATNTGPTTINISSIGAVAIQRQSSIGPTALSGGEITIGELVTVMYTGTVYLITSYVDTTPIGGTVQYRGSATPRGTLIEDGSCVSRTTYAPLFSVVGTTYGACDGTTTFAVPDSRGTGFWALDNQGANGAANRVTTVGSGCNATTVGLCGAQNVILTRPNLPNVGIAMDASTAVWNTIAAQQVTVVAGGGQSVVLGLLNGGAGGGGVTNYLSAAGLAGGSIQFNLNGNATQTTTVTLPPIAVGRRAIKY